MTRLAHWLPVSLLASVIVAASVQVPSHAEDNADQNLYVDYLTGSWDNWSFDAQPTWNAVEHVHSFSSAARVSFTKPWGALRLHYRGFDNRSFDTTGFTYLQFFVHWSGETPQPLLVYALRNEAFSNTTKLPLSPYSTPDPTAKEAGWYRVQVPLVDLGVSDVKDLTDILLTGPNPNVSFWIDDVKLVKPPGPARTTLNVYTTQLIRALDGRHLAVNTAAWDYLAADPTTINRVRAAGVRFFRFPGGSTADKYHWEQNLIGSERAGTGTLEFLKLVREAGGQPIITVNYRTGTPGEAANWVRFCNVTRNFRVKYWEIGSEIYRDADVGSEPTVYARRFREYLTAMKAVDPSIKVGMPGPYSQKEHNGWGPKVLKAMTARPDFYVVNYYPQVRWGDTPHEDDANLLQYSKDWQTIAQLARRMLNEHLGPVGTDVEILATENNSVAGQPGKQTANLVNALYLADSMGQLLNTEIRAFMWWDLHHAYEPFNNNSPVLYGHRRYGDLGLLSTTGHPFTPPNTPYPTYHALRLFSELGAEGSRLVASTSNHELLPVYAALRADSNLSVLVINKHSQKTLSATVNVTGFAPTRAQVLQYGAAEDAREGDISTREMPLTAPSFTFEFPSYSITVFTLRK
jgi:alpha-L-arabinofuranosidase